MALSPQPLPGFPSRSDRLKPFVDCDGTQGGEHDRGELDLTFVANDG